MQYALRGARPSFSAVRTLGLLFILLPLTVVAGYLLPSPVALMAPGPVEPVDALIKVEGTAYEPQGCLYLTTVRLSRDPRLGHYALALLQQDVALVPKSEVLPPFLSHEEFQTLSQRLLDESRSIAQVIALRQAGYDVRAGSSKVEVVRVIPGTPAAADLQPGDVIEAADREPLATTAELVSIVQGRVTGEPISLTVRRGQRHLTVTLPTVRGPLDAEGPVLGVVTVTSGFDFRAPVDIQVDPGPIAGGPSAGLMYALGVYNALATEDITRGYRIAGTGTLRLNGKVGPVGGVRLKVRAAEEAGAEYFLVSEADAAAARSAARDIQVIPVADFQGALQALREIDADADSPRVVPAAGDTTLARLETRD